MKVIRLDEEYYIKGSMGHWCPGCNSGHEITTQDSNYDGAKWRFNGHMECPSFTPSVNIRTNPKDHKHYQPDIASSVCHYFIQTGVELNAQKLTVGGRPPDPNKSYIRYLSDCTHALKGQIVELPDLPPNVYVTSQHLHVRR